MTAEHRLAIEMSDGGDGYFDYVQMAQVVSNLIEHAVKFSPPGSTIDVAAARNADTWTITVRDRGIGIAPDDAARIFERFYRGRTAAAQARGTGLGLAISKGIVEAHGGEIRFAPGPGGVGSVFTVAMPGAHAADSLPELTSA